MSSFSLPIHVLLFTEYENADCAAETAPVARSYVQFVQLQRSGNVFVLHDSPRQRKEKLHITYYIAADAFATTATCHIVCHCNNYSFVRFV